jgi:hypothetical protein
MPFAAQTDHRIKAVATVSAVCIGRMFSSGVDGKQDESIVRAMLDQAGVDRTNEARGAQPISNISCRRRSKRPRNSRPRA